MTVTSSRRHSFQGLRPCRHPRALSNNRRRAKEFIMPREQDNKVIVGRWFTEFWGNTWNPAIVDELCTPDILLQYSLHAPRRGRADVKAIMLSDVGKAGALTRVPRNVTFLSVAFRRRPARRCGSLERPFFASQTARSQNRSVSTMA